jgi:two-component system sensor histidine kinase KdpD
MTIWVVRSARDLDVHVISSGGEVPASLPDVHLPAVAVPRTRRIWAWVTLLVGLPLLIAVTVPFRDDVGVTTELLLVLVLVVGISVLGGLVPGIVAAVIGALAANFFFVPPYGTLTVGDPENLFALLVFVLVGATVSTLVDRVARRSAEAVRARADAESLTRAATTLATDPAPIQPLLVELRASLGLEAVSVLQLDGERDWIVVDSVGDDPPAGPTDGDRHALDEDGRTLLVTRGRQLDGRATELLEALLDQVAVAVESQSLQRDVALAEARAEADAVRQGILQAVSHDLRTPLAGIKASVTSLLSPDVSFGPDDTRTFLHTIDSEVDRLDRVVGNLLDMGRLQAGELGVRIRPAALDDVVAAAVDGLDPGREARVDIALPGDLPLVEVDAALVERAVANVVANALAVQPADVPVRIEADPVGSEVHLRVIDRGPGIAVDQRERVFAPFQRLGDRSTQAGVGLGLAIAQGFTGAVGGSLDLDDTPGGGLTVTFRLPVGDTVTDADPVVPS